MPFYPTLKRIRTSRDTTDTFYGYDARLKIPDGYFNNTENLTTDFFPMLANRRHKTFMQAVDSEGGTSRLTLRHPGGLFAKDALGYIADGDITFAGIKHESNLRHALDGYNRTEDEKQIISMGAYVCVFPDKYYFNTVDTDDCGYMEAHMTRTVRSYQMCHIDGTPYENVRVSNEEPKDENGNVDYTATWVSSDGTTTVYYQWSYSSKTWVELNTVYTRINFTHSGVNQAFKAMDGIDISGSSYEGINGSKVIYNLGEDYIVVIYPLEDEETGPADELNLDRTVPDLDFVCEAQNRLWGCKYGFGADGKAINEIYCCALGDFKNWNQFLGISTDSWVGSVGSDGQWTGAINYLGYPMFFKEDRIYAVNISTQGAHQITETVARGVQRGSHKSLKIVAETLFYKSRQDVCAFRGSFPESVSAALGDGYWTDAIGGANGSKYYLCMKNNGVDECFSYDAAKGLWMHEGYMSVVDFVELDDSFYAIVRGEGDTFGLEDVNGAAEGETEGDMHWTAETGILYYAQPDHKYVTRFDIRLKGSIAASVKVEIEYDSSGEWEDNGTLEMPTTNTLVYPVRPHRCDHMRIRLSGIGDVRILSLAKVLEVGTDV